MGKKEEQLQWNELEFEGINAFCEVGGKCSRLHVRGWRVGG
jgi:hypothetical protein